MRIACIAIAIGVASAALGQVQEEWVARYNGPANDRDRARAIAVDGEGNVYVTGRSFGIIGIPKWDYATLKYDAGGNQLWERRYNGPGDAWDEAVAVAVDPAGNVYVTGYSVGAGTRSDYATLKYDTNGTLLWVRRYNGSGNGPDFATALVVDSAGNVYVTGGSRTDSRQDYATIKYDTDGNLLWERRYNGPGNDNDRANAIALDDAGNVYVTGESRGSNLYYDYATLKYDADGNLLWIRRYDGPGNVNDRAHELALDGAGNVYVSGNSLGSGTGDDYATLKYDADGNQLWVRRYNGPGNSSDLVNDIGLDASGNLYVTGASTGSGTNYDFATLKYDSDGNQLWVRRYNGPANHLDGGSALEIDSAGNLYITGVSTDWDTFYDYTTFKYDAEGNVLWEVFYIGPVNNEWDIPYAIALDGGGNVYVTGISAGTGSGHDYLTIKYSQSVEVLPDSFSLFRGILTGGGLSDLFASDDSWVTVRPGITLNQAERQVQLILVGTAPTETPIELRFRLEAHASINNIGQWIELWNYDTSSWEQVDYMVATTVDSIVEVSITVDPGRFVQAGTKQMKAKVSYKEAGIVLVFPWLISFDQTVWVIVP